MKKNVHSKDLETIQMTTNKRTDKYFNCGILIPQKTIWQWNGMTELQLHRSVWLHLKNIVLSEKRKVTVREKKSKYSFMKGQKQAKQCILFSKHIKAENENKTLRHDSG